MPAPEFLQLGLFIVFAAAGLSKLISPRDLKGTLLALGLSRRNRLVATWLVPAMEVIAAVLLLLQERQIRIGAFLLVLLLLQFTYAVWLASRKKGKVTCHCFGSLVPETLGRETLLRIGLLLAADLYVVTRTKLVSPFHAETDKLVMAAGVWLGLFLLYVVWRNLMRRFLHSYPRQF